MTVEEIDAKLKLLDQQLGELRAQRDTLADRRDALISARARGSRPPGHPRTWTEDDWQAFLRPYTYGYQVERALNLPLKTVTGYLDGVGVTPPWRRRSMPGSAREAGATSHPRDCPLPLLREPPKS